MAKQVNFNDFLTPDGQNVYEFIKKHCEKMKLWQKEFEFEASMLANCLVLYRENAVRCNRPGGSVQEVGENGYLQVSVHYTIMKNEYEKILKHSPKFGLNPADLEKHFAGMRKEEKKPDFIE